MKALADWFDNRTGYRTLVREALYENIPGGSRWRYVWGSTLVFTFSVQVVTGLFLWMSYSASAQTAWESVYYIQHEMFGGWLLRGLHHYTAQAMVVLLVLHLAQVVIDAAYKAPREVNFWLGLILMLIVLGLSLTGYLLPWDQKGFWATRVATNLSVLTPVVGQQVQTVVVGGNDYGHHTLTRFFALHAGVLPTLLVGFLALHIYVFRRHGIRYKMPTKRPDRTFWPDQILKDAIACLVILAAVLFLIFRPMFFGGHEASDNPGDYLGAHLDAPADPTVEYDARPEWYFLFLFQFLKYFPGHSEIIGAIIIPGVVMGLLFLMPVVGRWAMGHVWNVILLCGLLAGIVVLTVAAVRDDYYSTWYEQPDAETDPVGAKKYASSKRYLAAVARSDESARRVKAIVRERGGIPIEGAVSLLRNDAQTQGPLLFAQHCASCHTHMDPSAPETDESKALLVKASAPNLWRFGSRQWLTGLLDPERVSGAHYFGGSKHRDGAMVEFVKGELQSDWTKEEIGQIIHALAAEADLPSDRPIDPIKVEAGKKLLADDSKCGQCHRYHNNVDFGSGPDLTGYASRQWTIEMISKPSAERFYGKNNDRMPLFAEHIDIARNRLSARQVEMLADWLRSAPAQTP